MLDPLDPSKTIIYQDNDFQRLTLKNGLEQIYNFGASGGTENIKYSTGAWYTDIEGTAIGTGYKRFS